MEKIVCLMLGALIAAAHVSFPPCGEELKDISAFPGEERYNRSLVIYNPTFSHLHPSFFAFPKSEKDVQRCLKCAYESGTRVVIRSGGHSELGYSTISSEGFVIYLSKMNQVVIDDAAKVVHVEAGARWDDIYRTISSRYLVVGGLCPTVGVSGFTLGGGYSMLSRYHGLAIDNLLSVTMVTANGSSVVEANSTVHSDLFWALRGGGGGNFGVVTRFTFQLHPTHTNYVYGTVKFQGEEMHNFLDLLNTAYELPKELCFNIYIFSSKRITLKVLFIGEYNDAIKILKPYVDIASFMDLRNYYTYDKVLSVAGELCSTILAHPEIMRGCLLKEISQEVAKILYEVDIPSSCHIALEHFGQAVSQYTPTETAFYHRNVLFSYYAPCTYSNTAGFARAVQFEDRLFDSLIQRGHCAGGYINDADLKVPDWQRFYYGGNYKRLVGIKQVWNPKESGMLHFRHEIGSDYQPNWSTESLKYMILISQRN